MDSIAPVEGDVNQLTEGLKDVEADADWKKESDLRLITERTGKAVHTKIKDRSLRQLLHEM